MRLRYPPWFWLLTAALLLAVALPTVLACRAETPDQVFGGFLFNPQDGNSYLAKMRQGQAGSWLFTLPFSADPGPGAALFVFYLFLGHVSRWTGLSLLAVFHLARLLAALALASSLYRFTRAVLPRERLQGPAFALAALGSGLGWLFFPAGRLTADLWVAEAYPFLSAYANPHFPLSLALLLDLLGGVLAQPAACGPAPSRARRWIPRLQVAAGALALAALSPFGVVVAVLVAGAFTAWEAWLACPGRPFLSGLLGRIGQGPLPWMLLGGLPPLVYDLALTRLHPALAIWNLQNQTPAPAPWDLVISLSPALLLAVPAGAAAWKGSRPGPRLLVAWLGLGLLLLYLPFGLQRRFLMGLYVPAALLAVLGIEALANQARKPATTLAMLVILLSLPTNLVTLLAGRYGVREHDPLFYLSRGEAQALGWIESGAARDALVLASADTGQWIPARTGRRVIYGHPFETVHAAEEKAAVTAFFSGALDPTGAGAFLRARGVDLVFYGPREQALGPLPAASGLEQVYAAAGVSVYAVARP